MVMKGNAAIRIVPNCGLQCLPIMKPISPQRAHSVGQYHGGWYKLMDGLPHFCFKTMPSTVLIGIVLKYDFNFTCHLVSYPWVLLISQWSKATKCWRDKDVTWYSIYFGLLSLFSENLILWCQCGVRQFSFFLMAAFSHTWSSNGKTSWLFPHNV